MKRLLFTCLIVFTCTLKAQSQLCYLDTPRDSKLIFLKTDTSLKIEFVSNYSDLHYQHLTRNLIAYSHGLFNSSVTIFHNHFEIKSHEFSNTFKIERTSHFDSFLITKIGDTGNILAKNKLCIEVKIDSFVDENIRFYSDWFNVTMMTNDIFFSLREPNTNKKYRQSSSYLYFSNGVDSHFSMDIRFKTKKNYRNVIIELYGSKNKMKLFLGKIKFKIHKVPK